MVVVPSMVYTETILQLIASIIRLGTIATITHLGKVATEIHLGKVATVIRLGTVATEIRLETIATVTHLGTVATTIDNEVQYIEIPTEKIYHTQILNGTKGTRNKKLTIEFTPETQYSQFAGFTSNNVLKIWVEADTVDGGSY